MRRFDSIVRGGTVVTGDGVTKADVAIRDGVVGDVAPDIAGDAGEEINARGLHVLPGAVDIHVHFNEPGRTSWEGWATGSAACAAGGMTTVAEMPLNAHPPVLDGPSFDAKREAAEDQSLIDFALWGGLTPRNLDHMEDLAERGVIGFKAFMSNSGIDDFPAADAVTLKEGMKRAAALDLPVAVHAEDEAMTAARTARAREAGQTGIQDFLDSRPVAAEVEAIRRALDLAANTGCALHVVHVSSGAGVAEITAAQASGVDVTAETCPHYLLFDERDVERLGGLAKCAPPLRPRNEVEALWRGVERGEIQVIASDHSPAPPDMKMGEDFFAVWGGISGCQTLLTSIISEGHGIRGLPLPLLTSALSQASARRLRLPGKGSIAPGADADLVLFDLDGRTTLETGDLHYRHPQSPFTGMTFAGWPVRTMLRGQTIARDGQPVGEARGRLLKPARERAASG